MRRSQWRFATGPGDFVPIFVGCVLLFVSLPAFVLLWVVPESDWGVIGVPLLVVLGVGVLVGGGFVVWGIRLCASPGSLAFRWAHGRFFRR